MTDLREEFIFSMPGNVFKTINRLYFMISLGRYEIYCSPKNFCEKLNLKEKVIYGAKKKYPHYLSISARGGCWATTEI